MITASRARLWRIPPYLTLRWRASLIAPSSMRAHVSVIIELLTFGNWCDPPSRTATSGSRVPSQRSVAAVRALTRAAKSQRDPRTSATGALLGHSRDPRQFAVVPFQPSASNLSEKSFRWESHVAGNQTPSHLCRAIWGGAAGPAEEDVRVVPLLTHAAVVSVAAGLITTGHTTTSAGRTPEGKGDPRNSAAAPIPAGRVRPPMMNWRRRENWRCPTARTWS